MKFKYIPSISLALAVLCTSCDVTDLNPLDSMTDQSYWRTTTDLQLYSNGLLANFGGASASGDSNSDVFVNKDVNSYLFNTLTVDYDAGWNFTLIRNCNYFMDRYQSVLDNGGDETTVNQYVGEVRFVRAIRYYEMIRLFGDVQWYDHVLSTNDTEELYKARDPRNMVLGKIIEDLEFAAKWCSDDKTTGRPTRDGAAAMLARVCLYYGTYMKYHNEGESNGLSANSLLTKAREVSQTLINSGKYQIVQASNPPKTESFADCPLYYSNLFVQEDLKNNAENIMARYYTYIDADHGTHEVGRQAGGMGYGLSKAFIQTYLMKDGTPISLNPNYTDNTLEEELTDRDPRLLQTIACTYRPNWTEIGEQKMLRWDYGSTIQTTAGVTGYPCEKFHSSNYEQWQAKSSTFDWFLYRYAEVLLINAEANYELGTCTQSVLDATINQLRDRVGMAHLTVSPVADPAAIDYGYTVDPLLYEIRRERAIELINEGFRMDDLKRWNGMKVLENPFTMVGVHISTDMEAFYADPDNGQTIIEMTGKDQLTDDDTAGRMTWKDPSTGKLYLRTYDNATMSSAGRKWSANDRRWLYPIPLTQLRLNPNLEQNPGWEKQ